MARLLSGYSDNYLNELFIQAGLNFDIPNDLQDYTWFVNTNSELELKKGNTVIATFSTSQIDLNNINLGSGAIFDDISVGISSNLQVLVGDSEVKLLDTLNTNFSIINENNRLQIRDTSNTNVLGEPGTSIITISDTGYMGVGTIPTVPLDVVGNTLITGNLTATGDVAFDSNTFFVDSTNNRIGVGTIIPSVELEVVGDMLITGNMTVNGTSTTINAETLSINDPMIKLANNNQSDIVDTGFYSLYNDGVSKYSGMFRDATTGVYNLYDGLENEPTTTVNVLGTGYSLADLQVSTLTATTVNGTLGTVSQPNITSASSLTSVGILNSLNMGGKINLANNTGTGGSNRGIEYFNSGDSGWGSYMSSVGLGESFSGGETVNYGTMDNLGFQIRNRVFNSDTNGFIWENHSEIPLMGLNGSSGDLLVKGDITATTVNGTLGTASQPNITSLGAQTATLDMNSNAISNVSTLTATTVSATNLGGTLTTAAQPNITSASLTTNTATNFTTISSVDNTGFNIINTGALSAQLKIANTNYQSFITCRGDTGALQIYNDVNAGGDVLAVLNSNASNIMSLTNDGQLSVGGPSPTMDIDLTKTTVGGDVDMLIRNLDNTNTSSGAELQIQAANGGGDPAITWNVAGFQNYTMGIDNSDGDLLKISNGGTLGTQDLLTINNTGDLEIVGDFTATTATSPTLGVPTYVAATIKNNNYNQEGGSAQLYMIGGFQDAGVNTGLEMEVVKPQGGAGWNMNWRGIDQFLTRQNVCMTLDHTGILTLPARGLHNPSNLPDGTRPPAVIGAADYEIRGLTGVLAADAGFLRLRTGGGTNIPEATYIDLSGYSPELDMTNSIVFHTNNTERMRIQGGSVDITGTLDVSTEIQVGGTDIFDIPYAKYSLSTTVSTVIGDGTPEIVVWNNELTDRGGFSVSGGAITVPTTGLYNVSYNLYMESHTAGDQQTYIVYNGGAFGSIDKTPTSTAFGNLMLGTDMVNVTTTASTIDIMVGQNTGTDKNVLIGSYVSLARIGNSV